MVIFRSKRDELGNRKVYPISGRGAPRGPNREEIAYLGALAVEGPEGENLRLGALDFMESGNVLLAQLYELEGILEAEGADPEEIEKIENAIGQLLTAQNDLTDIGTSPLSDMQSAMESVRARFSKASALIQDVMAGLPDGSPEAGSLNLAIVETSASLLDLEGDFRTYCTAMKEISIPSDPGDLMPHISPSQAAKDEEWHHEQIEFDETNESPAIAGPNEEWRNQQIQYDSGESAGNGNPGPAPLSGDVSYASPDAEKMKVYRLFPFNELDRKKNEEEDVDESL
jgi:hypothetical protein